MTKTLLTAALMAAVASTSALQAETFTDADLVGENKIVAQLFEGGPLDNCKFATNTYGQFSKSGSNYVLDNFRDYYENLFSYTLNGDILTQKTGYLGTTNNALCDYSNEKVYSWLCRVYSTNGGQLPCFNVFQPGTSLQLQGKLERAGETIVATFPYNYNNPDQSLNADAGNKVVMVWQGADDSDLENGYVFTYLSYKLIIYDANGTEHAVFSDGSTYDGKIRLGCGPDGSLRLFNMLGVGWAYTTASQNGNAEQNPLGYILVQPNYGTNQFTIAKQQMFCDPVYASGTYFEGFGNNSQGQAYHGIASAFNFYNAGLPTLYPTWVRGVSSVDFGGTFQAAPKHLGTDMKSRWEQDAKGTLVTEAKYDLKGGKCELLSDYPGEEATVFNSTAYSADKVDVTLDVNMDITKYGCQENVGVYVQGKFAPVSHAMRVDHYDLYVAPKVTDLANVTLQADGNLPGAINITDEAYDTTFGEEQPGGSGPLHLSPARRVEGAVGSEIYFNKLVNYQDIPGFDVDRGYCFYVKATYTAASGLAPTYHALTSSAITTGVNDIEADDCQAPVEYYTVMGQRVDNPAPGQVVIRRQGTRASKIVF